ncbi:hypothetical protein PybrP1_001245 [[Pythium] brassicae (nom. inval.)]|nr:hypothetical protein PybrP1_001245 [[Pythium] brassicae (nom. inval.)]
MADIVADLLWPEPPSAASEGTLEGVCALVRLPAHAHVLATRYRLVRSSLCSSATANGATGSVENVENGSSGMHLRLEELYVGLFHGFLRLRTPLLHTCEGSAGDGDANDDRTDDAQAANFSAKLLAAVARHPPPPPHTPPPQLSAATAARLRVFRDLWERGFHVAFGSKFAAELLVYADAPARAHAVALVLVRDWDAPLAAVQLASHCRVATMVKKRLLLASWRPLGAGMQEDEVVYVGVDHALLATRHETHGDA